MLWALLLCRAAEGLIEPADRERRKGGIHRRRQTHTVDREPVYSTHRPVQPATPERKETKGRGRHKRSLSESRESERERGKVKEEREGRKEREGGRRLGHEEGRLTDIAALCYLLTHTHTLT